MTAPRRSSPKVVAPLTARGEPLPTPQRIALVAAFGLVALLSIRQVGSLDAGFHLKAGEYILAGHGWPRTDPFTYTLTDHAYIDTSWGYQVLVASIQRLGGAPGLVLLHAALVLAAFFVVHRTARLAPVDPTSHVVFLLAGGLASEMRFEARPELLSWVFLVLVLHVLQRHALGLPSPLWALPLFHGCWANCHGLFVLGWGALACFLAGETFRRRLIPIDLAKWSIASVAVTLVNPYGWRGAAFPFTLATRLQQENPFAQTIGEFTSPFHLGLSPEYPFYPRVPIVTFRILAVFALLAVPRLAGQRRFCSALLVLPFLTLAVLMIRNIPLAALVSLPCVVWAWPAGPALATLRIREAARRRLLAGVTAAAALAAVLLGLQVVHDGYYLADRRPERVGLEWNRRSLPVDAAQSAAVSGSAGRS